MCFQRFHVVLFSEAFLELSNHPLKMYLLLTVICAMHCGKVVFINSTLTNQTDLV